MKNYFIFQDIYWNAPVVWNNTDGTIVNPDDKKGFLDLIKELKSAFEPKGLLVSFDISGSKKTIKEAYDVKELSKNVRSYLYCFYTDDITHISSFI